MSLKLNLMMVMLIKRLFNMVDESESIEYNLKKLEEIVGKLE